MAVMRSHTKLSLGSIVLFTALPFVWLACGGNKPAKSPDDTAGDDSGSSSSTSAAGSSSADMSSDNSSSGGSSAGSSGGGSSASSAAASSPPPPPPAPAFGDAPCGQCVEKACTKQLDACAKDNDCKSMSDAIHSCGSDKGASACLGSGTPPTAAKPKKLADAYSKCATKAATSKACKPSCQ